MNVPMVKYALGSSSPRTCKSSTSVRHRDEPMTAMAEQYVVDGDGKRTAVILPIEQYERLLEDLHDLAVVAERREEEPISLEEMKRRLKEDAVAVLR